jgi:hypothetical protein
MFHSTLNSRVGTRRSALIAGSIATVVLIGALLILANIVGGAPSRGPLQIVNSISVTSPMAAGQVGTWGEILPHNPTGAPITIRSIEPINPRGIDILGIGTNNPDVEGGEGFTRVFPPSGMTLEPVNGATLSPSTSTSPNLQILIGVRLSASSAQGAIDGLRVTYDSAGQTYILVIPGSLTLTLSANSPLP